MKSKVITIIGLIYAVLAVFITRFLLDRNEFGVYVRGNDYYIYNSAIVEFNKTSLVHFEKKDDYGYLVNEEVYYFDNDRILKKSTLVSFSNEDKSFSVQNGTYDVNNLLGKPDKGYYLIGMILGFFTTKLIYLVLVIIPVFVLLIYEVYLLFIYFKKGRNRKDFDDEKTSMAKE